MTEEFAGSPRHTLGVEWEVAFVDRDTRHLVPCAAEALEIIERDHPDHLIQREFLANTLELVTGVHDTVPDAMEDVGEQLEMVRTAEAKAVTRVTLNRTSGPVVIDRPDARVAMLLQPGQPERRVAMPLRELTECLSEELRRLDADEVYGEVLEKGLVRVGVA